MTPFETVLQHYTFPEHIKPHPLQLEAINDLAPLNNQGEWLDMGTGKTFVSTASALYHKVAFGYPCLVVMPPNLLGQWDFWLRSIEPALKVVCYRGEPAKRKLMTFDGDFVLVGINIFRKEYAKFLAHYSDRRFILVVDEATMIANVGSDGHEKVYELATGRPKIVLSGTPINKPGDGYGLMKFSAPGVYLNLMKFENEHVESRNFFGLPEKYRALDVLRERLLTNSKRILFTDMFSNAELPMFVPLPYDLEPAHQKLFKKLADEQILRLPDGGKIDGSTVNRLRHALGQIVINWGHFSGNPDDTSESVKLIEQKLDELGTGKLVVFADYRLTVRALVDKLSRFGAVGYNSEVSAAKKEKNKERFICDPTCRVIVIQFISGGKGLDGLQTVCNHMMFIEPCQQPRDFHQTVGRLNRMGQKFRVMVMMAIANYTTQVRAFNNLLKNDDTVNQVVRNATELRQAIYGEKFEA
jgi:hypothetical protein